MLQGRCYLTFVIRIGNWNDFLTSMVHGPLTGGTPVWSQLMIRLSGMSFISICALISSRKTWISANCVGEIFPALERFLFTYFIHLSRDFAQVFVMFTYPPCRRDLCWFGKHFTNGPSGSFFLCTNTFTYSLLSLLMVDFVIFQLRSLNSI